MRQGESRAGASASAGQDSDAPVDLDERLQFEHLIADLSRAFISMSPSDVLQNIHPALERAVSFLAADRITLVELCGEPPQLTLIASWARPGIRPLEESNVSRNLPWIAGEILAGRPIVLSNLRGLPSAATEEHAEAEQTGIRAILAAPVRVAGRIFGALSLTSIAPRTWTETDVRRVHLLGEIFANAFARARSFKEIEALKERLEAENVVLREEIGEFGDAVGRSEEWSRVLRRVGQVAATDANVLIMGETGTGKEVIAHAIHARSSRSDRAFVRVNCAAIPATLVESELFGHEKGAFTGATARKLGRFELADQGTIFLDEIGDLAPDLQAKLLRVLQHGEFERLGSTHTIKVDARVIAATNRDLARAMSEGKFRDDLYYRLNVFPIHLPPLRQRRDDIALLVWHFIGLRQGKLGKRIERVPQRTMQALIDYAWPGNVRELENAIERALILSPGTTLILEDALVAPSGSAHALPAGSGAEAPMQPTPTLTEAERELVLRTLELCGGRITGRGNAAERLGVNPSTLRSRMKKLGIGRAR
jgi:transcriptional regulator with GAF, ATPase, and Fis domain